jgi:hypothetical protein
MTYEEIIERLNANFCDMKALIEETAWGNLRKCKNGNKVQFRAEDVLSNLSEIIACIQEIKQ